MGRNRKPDLKVGLSCLCAENVHVTCTYRDSGRAASDTRGLAGRLALALVEVSSFDFVLTHRLASEEHEPHVRPRKFGLASASLRSMARHVLDTAFMDAGDR